MSSMKVALDLRGHQLIVEHPHLRGRPVARQLPLSLAQERLPLILHLDVRRGPGREHGHQHHVGSRGTPVFALLEPGLGRLERALALPKGSPDRIRHLARRSAVRPGRAGDDVVAGKVEGGLVGLSMLAARTEEAPRRVPGVAVTRPRAGRQGVELLKRRREATATLLVDGDLPPQPPQLHLAGLRIVGRGGPGQVPAPGMVRPHVLAKDQPEAHSQPQTQGQDEQGRAHGTRAASRWPASACRP